MKLRESGMPDEAQWESLLDVPLILDRPRGPHPDRRRRRAGLRNERISLCPARSACPEVEVRGDEVRIGEAGNLAILKKAEWNILVQLIRSRPARRIVARIPGAPDSARRALPTQCGAGAPELGL
jgi:hypothetical protein